MRNKSQILGGVAVLACIGLAGMVQAATVNTNLSVTITITNECTGASTTAINFGSHGFLTTDVDNTGTIKVTCTNGAAYTIGLGAGTGSGATVTDRKMTVNAGTATINYQLFRETGRTTNWGNTPPTDTVSGTGSGSEQTITVFGRVPAQASPIAGTYNDTVVVSINY